MPFLLLTADRSYSLPNKITKEYSSLQVKHDNVMDNMMQHKINIKFEGENTSTNASQTRHTVILNSKTKKVFNTKYQQKLRTDIRKYKITDLNSLNKYLDKQLLRANNKKQQYYLAYKKLKRLKDYSTQHKVKNKITHLNNVITIAQVIKSSISNEISNDKSNIILHQYCNAKNLSDSKQKLNLREKIKYKISSIKRCASKDDLHVLNHSNSYCDQKSINCYHSKTKEYGDTPNDDTPIIFQENVYLTSPYSNAMKQNATIDMTTEATENTQIKTCISNSSNNDNSISSTKEYKNEIHNEKQNISTIENIKHTLVETLNVTQSNTLNSTQCNVAPLLNDHQSVESTNMIQTLESEAVDQKDRLVNTYTIESNNNVSHINNEQKNSTKRDTNTELANINITPKEHYDSQRRNISEHTTPKIREKKKHSNIRSSIDYSSALLSTYESFDLVNTNADTHSFMNPTPNNVSLWISSYRRFDKLNQQNNSIQSMTYGLHSYFVNDLLFGVAVTHLKSFNATKNVDNYKSISILPYFKAQVNRFNIKLIGVYQVATNPIEQNKKIVNKYFIAGGQVSISSNFNIPRNFSLIPHIKQTILSTHFDSCKSSNHISFNSGITLSYKYSFSNIIINSFISANANLNIHSSTQKTQNYNNNAQTPNYLNNIITDDQNYQKFETGANINYGNSSFSITYHIVSQKSIYQHFGTINYILSM